MPADSVMPADDGLEQQVSLADLFLQTSRSLAGAVPQEFGSPSPKILLGASSYDRQTRKSLEALCRQHGVRGYSRMSKALMIQRLQQEGVAAPPVPMEALSKAELLSMLRDLLGTPEQNG